MYSETGNSKWSTWLETLNSFTNSPVCVYKRNVPRATPSGKAYAKVTLSVDGLGKPVTCIPLNSFGWVIGVILAAFWEQEDGQGMLPGIE